MDRNRDSTHKKAFQALRETLRKQFTDVQFIRILGIPRDIVNESLNSAASKRFSKTTRPPCREVFKAIIASSAACKNDGRGQPFCDVPSSVR